MLTYVHVNILLCRYNAFHNNNKHVNLKVYIGPNLAEGCFLILYEIIVLKNSV